MGSDIPKQFLVLKSEPVIMHTIKAFYNWDKDCEIILVLPSSQQSYWQLLVNQYDFDIPVKDYDFSRITDVSSLIDQMKESGGFTATKLAKARDLLKNSIKVLNEREKEILYSRRLNDNPTTLEDLSKKYKISRERVRQIENKAFEKLQKHMLLLAKSRNLLPVD